MKKKTKVIGISTILAVLFICITLYLTKSNPIIVIDDYCIPLAGAIDVKYKIYKNGDVYEYLHRSEDIEYEAVNYHKLLKRISLEEINEIKDKIKKLENSEYIEKNFDSNDIAKYMGMHEFWSVEVDNKMYTVTGINLYEYLLEQYLDENYEETISKRNFEKSIYNFIKNYGLETHELFPLDDEEKRIILDEYKKENEINSYNDEEILNIIREQALKMWYEEF